MEAMEVLEKHDRPVHEERFQVDEITWDEDTERYGFAVHSMPQRVRNAFVEWLLGKTDYYETAELNARRLCLWIEVGSVIQTMKFKQQAVTALRMASEG